MRRLGLSVTLLVLVTIASGCHHGAFGDGGEEPTQDALGRTPSDLVSTWVEMWNSYDLDQVGELFLTDDRVTYFSSEFEGVIQGFDEVVDHHRGFGFTSGGEGRETRLWVEGLTEVVFGGAAVLTGVWYFERAAPEGEAAVSTPQRGPVTFVCVLDGGRWRFAHMNFGNYLDPVEVEEG
jgi:hypothetical protein